MTEASSAIVSDRGLQTMAGPKECRTFTRQKAHADIWTLKATLISSEASLTAEGPHSIDICGSTRHQGNV